MGAEPLLVVQSETDERGYYIIHYHGRQWILLSPVTENYPGFNNCDPYDYFRGDQIRISFAMELLPIEAEPKPLPKKSWARSMGLRRP